jgi:hypothetical protein
VIARYAQYATTLAAALAADATTVVLTVGLAFEEGDEIHVGAEQITLGPKDGDTFTGCTRHVNGTAAAAHLAGDLVYRATTVDLCDAERTVATPVVTQNLAGGLDGEQHLVIYVATASTGFVYQHELLVSIREP